MASNFSERIDEAVDGPKQTTVDGQTDIEHALGDLIEADKYARATAATKGRKFPLRFGKAKLPDAVGRSS